MFYPNIRKIFTGSGQDAELQPPHAIELLACSAIAAAVQPVLHCCPRRYTAGPAVPGRPEETVGGTVASRSPDGGLALMQSGHDDDEA
ncbi:hypothetical protein KC336_g45 [Hortaea werneckii]|nr:hypothetical protein KC336_g45 [Hortaea werneckii]